ncbi:MAG TPA: beta-ketoacyl synthase N-terminal-like domain-containing protein, partial [Anaerolineales bacterium]|nr:beta-ketoacyl synthase N-terminal-like domain-containing protein [Anaerolineales bacterium]
MIADGAAGSVAIRIGARGPNMSLATACASGTNALGEAAEMIRRGAADVMVAGASEAAINSLAMAGMNSMTALSTRNDDPQKASRPFDKNRDGFVMGEGA